VTDIAVVAFVWDSPLLFLDYPSCEFLFVSMFHSVNLLFFPFSHLHFFSIALSGSLHRPFSQFEWQDSLYGPVYIQ
jgi:hypothetical protein